MNKLINTQNGGFDFKSDDLRWMQNSFIEAIKGLASPFQTSNTELVILSGCEETSTGAPNFDTIVTSGFVLYNGEIYYHASQIMSIPNTQFWYWNFQTYYDPNGLKVFKDQQAHDAYQVNRIILTESFSPQNTLQAFTSTKTIHQKIKDSIINLKSTWINLPTQYPGTIESEKTKYMKDIDGFVHLKGFYQIDIWFNSINLDTLPIGYRPINIIEFPYLMYNPSGVQKRTTIYIHPNGDIIYQGDDPTGPTVDGFIINLQLIPPFRTV
jgi:hypothetical protein